MCVISATRKRLAAEIVPVSIEHSISEEDNEEYAAEHAIDLELDTLAKISSPSRSMKPWLKVNLGKLDCIQQVISFNDYGDREHTWTCTSTDCDSCEGPMCSNHHITTSVERTSSEGLPPIADCKYGDTVTLEGDFTIFLIEIAIISQQG